MKAQGAGGHARFIQTFRLRGYSGRRRAICLAVSVSCNCGRLFRGPPLNESRHRSTRAAPSWKDFSTAARLLEDPLCDRCGAEETPAVLQFCLKKKREEQYSLCMEPQSMDLKVLAIDIGGTNVKIRVASDPQKRSFPSGPTLTPHQMVDGVLELAQGWEFDAVSIGLPAPIVKNKPVHNPGNLGKGWVDFNYAACFAKQVKLINDAAMQAVGSYEGGRMLFLGFGTGLGSCLIAEHVIVPTEIAHMPYREGGTFEDAVGIKAFEKHRKKHWTKDVYAVIEILSAALIPDYIVLGGGNSAKLQEIPPNCRLGDNAHAFTGGFRMWTPEWAHSVAVYHK